MYLPMGIQITTLITTLVFLNDYRVLEMMSKEITSVQLQEMAGPCQTLPTSHRSGKAALWVLQAGSIVLNLSPVSHRNWTTSGTQTKDSPIPAATTGSSSPVVCNDCKLAFFVSLRNNSSCFQSVLNPPGNLTLLRRRVLLYVISRQQLWSQHPERGSLCITMVSGMNFPSPPHHLFKGCWKHTVSLCAYTASSDFCQQLWGACPFALIAGYPQNLHNHLFYYFLVCILRDWTSHLPTQAALVLCIQTSRVQQYYWKVTLSIFNIQKYRTAVLSHSPFV